MKSWQNFKNFKKNWIILKKILMNLNLLILNEEHKVLIKWVYPWKKAMSEIWIKHYFIWTLLYTKKYSKEYKKQYPKKK